MMQKNKDAYRRIKIFTMIPTEEQRYLQKNKITYRRTMMQKNKDVYRRIKIFTMIPTEEQRFYRITIIFTKEHPPDGRFICSSV
jgi:hypothetical protein